MKDRAKTTDQLLDELAAARERIAELQGLVAKRTRVVEELKKKEEHYRLLAENLNDVFWTMDEGLHFTYLSPSIEKLSGFTREEAMKRSIGDLLTPSSFGAAEKAFQDQRTACFASENSNSQRLKIELEHVLKDGSLGWSEVDMTFLRDSTGAFAGIVGVSRNVSERKRAEEALRESHIKVNEELARMHRLDSLGALAGGIAHDFGNLLTAIMGSISLAKQAGEIEPSASGILLEAERASLRAMNLTRQLLTFAKGGEPAKKTVSMARLLKETALCLPHRPDVKCEYSVPEELWPAEVDEAQFSQVIQNLIINAVEAMPDGGLVSIRARNHCSEENDQLNIPGGRQLIISISDQGTGIPREIQSRIFDPFFSTKEQGSGLGLSVAHSIIRRHRGHLTVESEPGAGTVFHIHLPAREESPSPGTDPQWHHTLNKCQ